MRIRGVAEQAFRAALDGVHKLVPCACRPRAIKHVLSQPTEHSRVDLADSHPDDEERRAAANDLVADMRAGRVQPGLSAQEAFQLEERMEPLA